MTDTSLTPAQLRVRVRAAGLNRADLLNAEARGGVGPHPGLELAGEVIEVGADATGWSVGDRLMSRGAGFAPEAIVQARNGFHLPDDLSFEEAAGLPVAITTMHDAIATKGEFVAGQRVLINAATSGVGIIGVQLAGLLGASTVFATSRSDAKLKVLADHVGDIGSELVLINTTTEQFETVATEVDVIVDNVGGSVLAGNLAACSICARIVQVGRLGGGSGEIDLEELSRKRISLIGVSNRTRTVEEVNVIAELARADIKDRYDKLRPRIEKTYPLADLEKAFSDLAANDHVGKIIITV